MREGGVVQRLQCAECVRGCRQSHLKRQGRCETKPIREVAEDAEEAEVELTEDETEEAPAGGNIFAPVSDDAPVLGGAPWTAVFSSNSRFAKGQVRRPFGVGVGTDGWALMGS